MVAQRSAGRGVGRGGRLGVGFAFLALILAPVAASSSFGDSKKSAEGALQLARGNARFVWGVTLTVKAEVANLTNLAATIVATSQEECGLFTEDLPENIPSGSSGRLHADFASATNCAGGVSVSGQDRDTGQKFTVYAGVPLAGKNAVRCEIEDPSSGLICTDPSIGSGWNPAAQITVSRQGAG